MLDLKQPEEKDEVNGSQHSMREENHSMLVEHLGQTQILTEVAINEDSHTNSPKSEQQA